MVTNRRLSIFVTGWLLVTAGAAASDGGASVMPIDSTPVEAIQPPVLEQAPLVIGRVVNRDGAPLAGAHLRTDQGSADSNGDGWFAVASAAHPVWVTATHTGYLSRTRAGAPGEPLLIRLTPDDGQTISLHFGGDTMAGRRFYDVNEDGNTSDGLISTANHPSEFKALLEPVRPLLENADLSLVNMESPLTPNAYVDPTQPRPAGFHPTKDYVFASHPALAEALRDAGIDLVGLGNNHMYDYLEQGLVGTRVALNDAGLAFFGASGSEVGAWQPAILQARGQSLAFLACTSITGTEHAISYVANDKQAKGGAAACSTSQIQKTLASVAPNEHRILMIHGGYEYGSQMSNRIQSLSDKAREAGATLVINHHPHVVGGFQWDGKTLIAATLGNFLFDQTVWRTLPSYLLGVHMRHGQVVRAYTEPLMVEDYRPKGLTGAHGRYVAREAAAEPGPFILENGAMELDVAGQALRRDTSLPVESGGIFRLGGDQWVSAFSGDGSLRLGRDLLWVGDFEDMDVDGDSQEQSLWRAGPSDLRFGAYYAHAGQSGVRLYRDSNNSSDLVLNQLYRITLDPGTELSLVGKLRSQTGARLTAQLSWYPDTRGGSNSQTQASLVIPAGSEWRDFRLDGVAPGDAVATGLVMKLPPPNPAEMAETWVDLDDLRLIAWAPAGTSFGRRYDHIQVTGTGQVTLTQEVLPGGEPWLAPGTLTRLSP